MSAMLRFRANLHVEIVQPDLVFLLSEYTYATLRGRLYVLIAPYLNDGAAKEQIAAALSEQAEEAAVYNALIRLQERGYVETIVTDRIPSAQDAYFEGQSNAQALNGKRIALHCYGLDDIPSSLETSLRGMIEPLGINLSGEQPDLSIVLVRDYLSSMLEQVNRTMLASGQRWLLAKPVGSIVWIGPLFEPGYTACWQCLAQRIRYNRRIEGFIEQALNYTEPIALSRAALPSTIQTALGLAATAASRWLAGQSSGLSNTLFTLDTQTLQSERHPVTKRPQCPVCGKVDTLPPIKLNSQPDKNYSREAAAQQTLAAYKHHIDPITGIVPALQPTLSNEVIYTYTAGNNTSRPLKSWDNMRRSLRSLNVGKGVSEAQAKVSALCEALERYSGQYEGSEPKRRATYRAIADEAIHPERLLLYSDAQYENRVPLNEQNPPHLKIPNRFDPDQEIDWTPVWSLSNERTVWIPTAYCYYGYVQPEEEMFCYADSNGCAAGRSLEDAILHGFLELVERDAIALWWYNKIRRPAVTFSHPYYEQMKRYYALKQRELWLLDLTTDFQIPAMCAVSRRIDKPTEDIVLGFGAHLSFETAVLRALTELNQSVVPILEIDATCPSDFGFELTWWQTATLETDPYLSPDSAIPITTAAAFSAPASGDVLEQAKFCLERSKRLGLELLVLNQTRPDIGLPTVRVMMPGVRHFWSRFAPGRLYNIPVRLGWLASPIAENDLNPKPMFL